jgi:hypothetical protein
VTIENCWSFYNGYSTAFASLGDGNGFKVGGFGVTDFSNLPATIPRHNVRFCLAVRNKSSGFYANHHLGGNNWYNNAAYLNAVNYNMLNRSSDHASDVPGYDHNLKNNLGFGARSTEVSNLDMSASDVSFNYFTLSVTVNSSDFLSIDQSLLTAARQSDGSLPVNNFMRLATSSDCINKGTNVGFAYNGSAPDLGCFESSVTTRQATEPETSATAPGLSVFPNPVKGKIVARYSLAQDAKVQLGLYDAKGALLAVLLNREQAAGNYTYPVAERYFKAAGLYFLKLHTPDKTETVTLVR